MLRVHRKAADLLRFTVLSKQVRGGGHAARVERMRHKATGNPVGMETTKIGIVGCGNISEVYLRNARKLEILETVACADLVPERARAKAGTTILVEVPTHVVGVMDFAGDAIRHDHHLLRRMGPPTAAHRDLRHRRLAERAGLERLRGPVRIRRPCDEAWSEVPLTRPYAENSRGLGVADMAQAIRSGRPHRASGRLAYHVLDVMHAFHEASDTGRHVDVASACDRPAPLRAALKKGTIDA